MRRYRPIEMEFFPINTKRRDVFKSMEALIKLAENCENDKDFNSFNVLLDSIIKLAEQEKITNKKTQ